MRNDDRNEEQRRCGRCGKSLRPNDLISVGEVGERCDRCFSEELAQRLGVDFDNTPIAPIVVTDVDGVRHRFEIRSMLVGTGHAMYAREVGQREAQGGYRFAILGDREADAQELLMRLRERIRHGLSVRHVQETEQGWQLTQAHRLSGVIEWDPKTEGALPLLIVDGRTFTWDQIGRMMMTFEGFTLNAIVEDTIEVVGGPLADGRLASHASSQSAPAVPAPVIRPGASNRRTAKRGRPTRSWPPSPRLKRRCPDIGLLHHSDQGCTYASEDYQDILEARGIVCSMSRRGNCWDNAVMESFFSTVKSELGERFESNGEAKMALFDYVGAALM